MKAFAPDLLPAVQLMSLVLMSLVAVDPAGEASNAPLASSTLLVDNEGNKSRYSPEDGEELGSVTMSISPGGLGSPGQWQRLTNLNHVYTRSDWVSKEAIIRSNLSIRHFNVTRDDAQMGE